MAESMYLLCIHYFDNVSLGCDIILRKLNCEGMYCVVLWFCQIKFRSGDNIFDISIRIFDLCESLY